MKFVELRFFLNRPKKPVVSIGFKKMWDYLEDESSHFCEPGGALLEAVEVFLGEDEESLLPPGEELVPLLPQKPLLDEGISLGAVTRVGENGIAVVVGGFEVRL